MTAAVRIRGLRKRYGDTVAVEEVSFQVAEGEISGLLGRNGSGKTTTVECIRDSDSGTEGTSTSSRWTRVRTGFGCGGPGPDDGAGPGRPAGHPGARGDGP